MARRRNRVKRSKGAVRGPKPSRPPATDQVQVMPQPAPAPRPMPMIGILTPQQLIDERGGERFHALADEWDEEARQHTLNGNPRRAHYIEQFFVPMAQELGRAVRAGKYPSLARGRQR